MTDFFIGYKHTFLKRTVLRFVVVYFALYIFPFPFTATPINSPVTIAYHSILEPAVSWLAVHVFRLSNAALRYNYNGSSDSTYHFVLLFLIFIIAIFFTICWYLADKRGRQDKQVFYWLWLYLRFFLAFAMIDYGMLKVMKTQFPFPYYSLNETYGASSPNRLFVSFMGYSAMYNVFTGLLEVLGGCFVFFRKTLLLGTLLCVAVLSNVVMLNMSFDVPVKLTAIHLLLLSLVLLAPYIKTLAYFFLSQKAVVVPSVFGEHKPRIIAQFYRYLLMLILCFTGYVTVSQSWFYYWRIGDGLPKRTPLFGLYRVEMFVRNKDTLLPLTTDTTRWDMLNVVYPRLATVKMMNGEVLPYRFLTNQSQQKIVLYPKEDSVAKSTLQYTIPDSAHLWLRGKLMDDSVRIYLRKEDISQMELLKRGFHWINESPHTN